MIIYSKFTVLKKLGDGHYATTFLVVSNSKTNTALKLFKKNYNAMSTREQSMFINETNMVQHSHHDNLVKVLSHKKYSVLTNAQ